MPAAAISTMCEAATTSTDRPGCSTPTSATVTRLCFGHPRSTSPSSITFLASASPSRTHQCFRRHPDSSPITIFAVPAPTHGQARSSLAFRSHAGPPIVEVNALGNRPRLTKMSNCDNVLAICRPDGHIAVVLTSTSCRRRSPRHGMCRRPRKIPCALKRVRTRVPKTQEEPCGPALSTTMTGRFTR